MVISAFPIGWGTPEAGLVLHMVGNLWADVFLWKNACSLKLNGAEDMDFYFF